MAFGIKIPLIGWASLALILGIGLSFIGAVGLQTWAGIMLNWMWICLFGGLFAAIVGYLFGLPVWWIPLNGFFPIGVFFLLSTTIPAWAYLVCFVVLLLFYWNSAGDRVPLYLSNPTTWRALAKQVKSHDGPFIDLGCGLGGALFYLSAHFPERRFIGIESAPLPYVFAKVRKLITGRQNVEILYGDFWHLDLSQYQTVYAFLSPAPMQKLYEKVEAEMPAGGQLISNSFLVPGNQPGETKILDDSRQTNFHIWHF